MNSNFLNDAIMSLLHEMGLKLSYQFANVTDTSNDAIKSYCDGCNNDCSNDCYGGCQDACKGACMGYCDGTCEGNCIEQCHGGAGY